MNVKIVRKIITILSIFIATADTARILAFFSPVSYSNLLVYSAVTETLAEAGHNVTVLSNYPNPNSYSRHKYAGSYSYVHLPGQIFYDGQRFINSSKTSYQKLFMIINDRFESCNRTLNHPKMMEFLQTYQANDFDLVIVGYMFMDFLFGLGAHFQCPIVAVITLRPPSVANNLLGNPEELSYNPRLMKGWKPPMTFEERLKNFLTYIFERFVIQSYFNVMNRQLYR